MFFTFPENAHWNAEQQAVEFGVEIGEYRGVVRVSRRVFQRLLSERPTPERCVEAYYLQRTRFEGIAERKVRRRHLPMSTSAGGNSARCRRPTLMAFGATVNPLRLLSRPLNPQRGHASKTARRRRPHAH